MTKKTKWTKSKSRSNDYDLLLLLVQAGLITSYLKSLFIISYVINQSLVVIRPSYLKCSAAVLIQCNRINCKQCQRLKWRMWSSTAAAATGRRVPAAVLLSIRTAAINNCSKCSSDQSAADATRKGRYALCSCRIIISWWAGMDTTARWVGGRDP